MLNLSSLFYTDSQAEQCLHTELDLESSERDYIANAKTTVRDVKLMVMGTTRHAESKRTEPTKVRISAAERAAFAALVKTCGDVKRLRAVVKALAV